MPGPDPDHTALVAALRQLPTAQRRVIVLHHLCDLSVERIASETGAPVGTVKARLFRGRAALAKHLAVDEPDTPVAPAAPVTPVTPVAPVVPVRKESGRV